MALKWAFIDESKSSAYHLVAVVISAHELPSARKLLKELTLSGQRRIHFRTESSSRRNLILAKIKKLDFEIVRVISTTKGEINARRECMLSLLAALGEMGVTQVAVERDLSMLTHDKQTLHLYREKYRFTKLGDIGILDAYQEPLLWLADISAWMTAKGHFSVKPTTTLKLD
jgi:hypothetical protein